MKRRRTIIIEETWDEPAPAKYPPWSQPWTVKQPPWIFPQARKVICPQCGIDFSGPMGYVCPSSTCPIQAKVTC